MGGNIQTLERNGLLGTAGIYTQWSTGHPYGPLDDLSYDYDGNQLLGVYDQITDPQLNVDIGIPNHDHFLDGNLAASGDDYDYDVNGNLTQDLNKDITNIEYNFLNLPTLVEWGDGKSIEWVYDAMGQKLQKIVDDGADNITVKNYIGNSEYADGNLEAIYHAEGRATPVGYGTYDYEYTITDHLGNGWVWWRWAGDAETGAPAETLQTGDYYPFGLEHANPDALLYVNSYRFNGSVTGDTKSKSSAGLGMDKIDDIDLGIHHAFYRSYDPIISRMMQIDPLTEQAAMISLTP